MGKKLLKQNYDYNDSIKKKVDNIAINEYGITDEIKKAQLFNLALNLCNQMVYDYVYVFTKHDLYFVAEHNINVHKLIDACLDDIKIMAKREGVYWNLKSKNKK